MYCDTLLFYYVYSFMNYLEKRSPAAKHVKVA